MAVWNIQFLVSLRDLPALIGDRYVVRTFRRVHLYQPWWTDAVAGRGPISVSWPVMYVPLIFGPVTLFHFAPFLSGAANK